MDFLQHVFAFVCAIGILVGFHEYGHFLVARYFDVKILRFSLGFGRPLYLCRFGPDNSEFTIAAVPLGGYVKMLDEREDVVRQDEAHRAFNNKLLGQRFAIVLAGPLFNFIFAIAAYSLVFALGVTGHRPVVGEVESGSIAARAGLMSGQEILSVNGKTTRIWASVMDETMAQIIEGDDIEYQVRDEMQQQQLLNLNISQVSIDDIAEGRLLERLGIEPKRTPIYAIIGQVLADGAASEAGLLIGDEILRADGNEIVLWKDWVEYVREHPDQSIELGINRQGQYMVINITPRPYTENDGRIIGRVGVQVEIPEELDPELLATERYGLVESIFLSLEKTWDMSLMLLRMLRKMLIGQASIKNLSGPISIAQYAGYTAASGAIAYISFLAIVSVSLGVLNLFPIPLLDGGHLMYYLVEFVKGSPVSETTQVIGQQIGLVVLLGLMILVFYNDIARLI